MRHHVPFTDLGPTTREVRTVIREAWEGLLDSSQFIGGEAVEQFEQAWAEYCATSHAVGMANGTDAIQLTLSALGIGPGDEVIVPANTFVASVEAIVLAGARPRFADVDDDTLLLTPETLQAAITPSTRAVIVVHLYGQMPDVDALCRTAESAGLVLIEDAAQAHGATWRGKRAGSVGAAACFSFYPGKNLGAFGDAGAVVTSDARLAERLRCLRDHGRAQGSHYRHERIGTNSRLDALQAVVLSAKLTKLDAWTQMRREIVASYRAAFASGPIRLVHEAPEARGVYHLAVARVPNRAVVRKQLESMGIQTGIHYPTPCHQQGPYMHFAAYPLPVAEKAADEILSLPIFPHMTTDQVALVCEAVQDVAASGASHVA